MKEGTIGEGECLTLCEQMFLIFSPAVPFLDFLLLFIPWPGTTRWCFWAGLKKAVQLFLL